MVRISYNQKPFKERFYTLGDISEAVYEEAHPLGPVERYGWNRPKNVHVRHMPQTLRNQPDFYSGSNHFVEVMGVGRDGVVKGMKVHKWESYKKWKKIATIMEVEDLLTFIWNSDTEEYVILSYEQMKELVAKGRRAGVKAFDDGNEYYPIQWKWVTETVDRLGVWHIEH